MYKRILVALDGGPVSSKALEMAIKLAATVYARLRLVHVLEAPAHLPAGDRGATAGAAFIEALRQDGERILRDAAAQARLAGVEAECMLVESWTERAGAALLSQASLCNADLIVVGTHGRRGIHRILMGSDAEYVVRHASQNVLVVRGAPA